MSQPYRKLHDFRVFIVSFLLHSLSRTLMLTPSSRVSQDTPMPNHKLNDPDSVDLDASTDTSSEDEEEEEEEEYDDPLESLHYTIRQVFSYDTQLADNIINYLHRLPPDRRGWFYRYGKTRHSGSNGSQIPNQSSGYGENPVPRKRKRGSSEQRLGSAQKRVPGNKDDVTNNGQDEGVLVVHRPSTPPVCKRFACGYNIYDKDMYSPRNTRGRTATQYKSCAGPGFESLNHYKSVVQISPYFYIC